MKSVDLQVIEPGESLDRFSAKSQLNIRLGFLQKLRDFGRENAQTWLEKRAAASLSR